MSLSEYELSRAERIKANNAYLMALGLLDDAKALKAKPKAKAPPKPKQDVIASTGPARTSSRLSGVPIEESSSVDAGTIWMPDPPEERHPLCCWWTPEGIIRPPLTPEQKRALSTALSDEERETLVVDDGDEWVNDALCFLRAYGGKMPEPFCVPSRDNFKKVISTVAVLASGEGVSCNYKTGKFDEGVRYTPRHDLDAALKRALIWLPLAKDKSNGWTFTHPFEKMKQYQRALFWRHLFPFVWPDARPTAHAQASALARAQSASGDEASVWANMSAGQVESRALSVSEATTAAPTPAVPGAEPQVPSDDEDQPISKRQRSQTGKRDASSNDEDQPISKRQKSQTGKRDASSNVDVTSTSCARGPTATQPPQPVLPNPRDVARSSTLQPGTRVKARYMASSMGPEKAAQWYEGMVTSVNPDGTCNIRYDDDGDEEEDVEPEYIRYLR
eukprot:jgi/Chrpa1/6243/Chrysochromulina_OHIO_Genome00015149-RA